MEIDLGEFIHTIRGKFSIGPKASDLIPPPLVTRKESPQAKMPAQQIATSVKLGMKEIQQLPKLKVDPQEFNKRNKN